MLGRSKSPNKLNLRNRSKSHRQLVALNRITLFEKRRDSSNKLVALVTQLSLVKNMEFVVANAVENILDEDGERERAVEKTLAQSFERFALENLREEDDDGISFVFRLSYSH